MAKKQLPSPETLRQLLRYEPETGKLYWLPRNVTMFKDCRSREAACNCWNTKYAHNEAFTSVSTAGYHHGTLGDRTHRAHRIIWAIVHGEWPANLIDHINGARADNRLVNLRVVTNRENARNKMRHSNNASGVNGVSWDPRESKWYAYITIGKRMFGLGRFSNFNEAVEVRKDAEKELGFHANHGRSA